MLLPLRAPTLSLSCRPSLPVPSSPPRSLRVTVSSAGRTVQQASDSASADGSNSLGRTAGNFCYAPQPGRSASFWLLKARLRPSAEVAGSGARLQTTLCWLRKRFAVPLTAAATACTLCISQLPAQAEDFVRLIIQLPCFCRLTGDRSIHRHTGKMFAGFQLLPILLYLAFRKPLLRPGRS